MSRSRQAGFTLLEILVALVVLGFLLAGLAQGVRFGLRAWDSQSRVVEGHGDADAIDRLLRRLIEQAEPGRGNVAAEIAGTDHSLSFVTRLSGPAGARLSQVAIGVDAAHRLVLRWTPYVHGQRLQPMPAAREDTLQAAVERVEIAYWGPGDDGARSWHAAWSAAELPDLIQIRLVFPAGDARRWPPIVVAPMRGRGG